MNASQSAFDPQDCEKTWQHFIDVSQEDQCLSVFADTSHYEPQLAVCVGLGSYCPALTCQIKDKSVVITFVYSDKVNTTREPWTIYYEITIESKKTTFEHDDYVVEKNKRIVRNIMRIRPKRLKPQLDSIENFSSWKRMGRGRASCRFVQHELTLASVQNLPFQIAFRIRTVRSQKLDPSSWERVLKYGYESVVFQRSRKAIKHNEFYVTSVIK